jgi:hypothetical protein
VLPSARVLTALFFACADVEGETAPASLESQSLLALQRFYEDDAGDQVSLLLDLLDKEDRSVPGGFYFDQLAPEDVEMFEHSDEADWDHTAGCGVLAEVRGELQQYVDSVPEEDQSFPDPTYAEWTRSVSGGDVGDFLAGEGDLQTDNHIEKSYVIYTVEYDMDKDFRWFDDTLAMISLVPDGRFPDDGGVGLVVGFTLELWYLRNDTVVWYNASWTEIESPLDEDAQDKEAWLDILISGTLDYYWGTEEHVTGEPHTDG